MSTTSEGEKKPIGEVIANMIKELDSLPEKEDVTRVLRTIVAYYDIVDDLA